ncbi:MAG TPA: ABC transporter substrate-binding protein [Firmicutes bacterium]|nr:ABC transporter substrate-binding protein [Bacillota bacterium]HHY97204.1 ABC transporter substrate-binding protein [Bacillota bacterium]
MHSRRRSLVFLVSLLGIWFAMTSFAFAGTVTLKFWHGFNAHEITKLQELVDKEFTPSHPNIKIDTLAPVSPEKILSSIAGGNPPDVAILWDSAPIASWAYNGALTPLDDFIKKSKTDMNAFVPAGIQLTKINNHQWAMPFVLYNQAFYWNKDLFKAAGLNPEKPPQTIGELTNYIEKLTVKKGQVIQQIGFIPQTDLVNMSYFFGGSLYDAAANKITADHPQNVKALEWEVGLIKKYGVQAIQNFASGFGKGGAGDNPFYLGKLAMALDGVWQLAFIPKYAPKLNFGVASFPYLDGHPELKGTNVVGTNPIIIPKGAKHPKEAWEFVEWLSTSKAVAKEFSAFIANIPHLKGLGDTFTKDPQVRLFVDLSENPNARVVPPIPVIEMYVNDFYAAADKAYNLQSSPGDVLKEVTAKIQAELNKVRW